MKKLYLIIFKLYIIKIRQMSANINGLFVVLAIFGGLLFLNVATYYFYVLYKKFKHKNNIDSEKEIFLI